MKRLMICLCLFLLLVGCTQQKNNIQIANVTDTLAYTVYVFDVGQGSSTLFVINNTRMLVDTGEDPRIINYLHNLYITKIDTLMLTHPDKDHIGEAEDILKTFKVDAVIWNGQRSDTKVFKDLMTYIESNNIHLYVANISNQGIPFKIYNPQNTFYNDDNDNSIVTIIRLGKIDVYLGGDCSEKCENALNITKSEIYIVDHHGSKTSSVNPFLTRLSPDVCLISVNLDNQYGHPSQEALKRMDAINCKVFTTINGTIVIRSNGREYSLSRL